MYLLDTNTLIYGQHAPGVAAGAEQLAAVGGGILVEFRQAAGSGGWAPGGVAGDGAQGAGPVDLQALAGGGVPEAHCAVMGDGSDAASVA